MTITRYDPSRTTLLQRSFIKEIRRVFNLLKKRIVTLFKDDVFGVKEPKHTLQSLVNYHHIDFLQEGRLLHPGKSIHIKNANWRFLSTPEKAKAFKVWLSEQVKYTILNTSEKELWDRFISDGYKRGVDRSYRDAKKRIGDEVDKGQRDSFLREAFGRALNTERLRLLTGRTEDEIKSLVGTMENGIVRVVTQHLLKGSSSKEIATELIKTIGISEKRAYTIARTEIIRAHAEGQLDAMERLGENEVGIQAEWSTAHDDRVCPICADMDGTIITIKDARGVIPLHPNCRCIFLPIKISKKGRKLRKRVQDKLDKAKREIEEEDED